MKSLIFDQSGTSLALGGTDVQIYICKQWTEILHFTGRGLPQDPEVSGCSGPEESGESFTGLGVSSGRHAFAKAAFNRSETEFSG